MTCPECGKGALVPCSGPIETEEGVFLVGWLECMECGYTEED